MSSCQNIDGKHTTCKHWNSGNGTAKCHECPIKEKLFGNDKDPRPITRHSIRQQVIENIADNKPVQTIIDLIKKLPPEEGLIIMCQMILEYSFGEIHIASKTIASYSIRSMQRIRKDAIEKIQKML